MTDSGQVGRARIRVAIVAQSLDDGGLERLVQTLALSLDPEEFEPAVFALRELGVYKQALDAAGIAVRDCRESGVKIRGIPLRLIRELRGFRPHIIHAHSGTWLPASISKSVLRSPKLVYTEHGRYPPEPRLRALVEGWCAARTDAITAVSTHVSEYLVDYLGLDRPPRVLPNGIVPDPFQNPSPDARARLRSEWRIADDQILFACVGRLVEVKNHRDLLHAFAGAGDAGPRMRLALFGQGPLEGEMRKLARELDLDDRVRFLGFREDVGECLNACDAFVLASRTEGMPLSVLEALASGLPIVATSVGGVPEVLGEPAAGILVPPGDVDALGAALGRVAASETLRSRLSERARERAKTFTIDECVGRYARLFRELAMPDGTRRHRRRGLSVKPGKG